MKSYFINSLKNKLLLLFTLSAILITGCHPGYIVPGKVETISRSSLIHLSNTGHLIIFPFETIEHSPKLSLEAAERFNEEINKYNFFKKITLIDDNSLLIDFKNHQLKIQKALYYANEQNADAILLGKVEEYSYSVSVDTKVSLKIMIIDVKSGEKLWWGGKTVIGKQGNTFLLIGNRLSPNPPSAQKLLLNAVKKITASIFTSN